MKNRIKALMFRWFPRWATEFFSARSRAHSHRLVRAWGCVALGEKLIERHGDRVLHGPFAGLVLSRESRREHIAPFLLGSYEHELHDAWDRIFGMKFSMLVDVGAKFGFYAIALGKRFPGARVVAFDTDPWARRAVREMAEANDSNVEVRGWCDPAWLREHLTDHAFVFSDCEGYEATLFTTLEIPALRTVTMLIEIHEEFSPGVAEKIRGRFSGTHRIEPIAMRTKDWKEIPELASLEPAEREMAINEHRAASQSWLFLTPRKS